MSTVNNVPNMQMCSSCGETPCVASNYAKLAQDCKTSNAKDNKSTRYFACKKHIRDTHAILGKGQRVKLLYCVESSLKASFPNEDETPFVGFRGSIADY